MRGGAVGGKATTPGGKRRSTADKALGPQTQIYLRRCPHPKSPPLISSGSDCIISLYIANSVRHRRNVFEKTENREPERRQGIPDPDQMFGHLTSWVRPPTAIRVHRSVRLARRTSADDNADESPPCQDFNEHLLDYRLDFRAVHSVRERRCSTSRGVKALLNTQRDAAHTECGP